LACLNEHGLEESQKAKEWIADHIEENAMWFGHALVVEHRYAWGLAGGLREAGLGLE
jgi:squalene cyclase